MVGSWNGKESIRMVLLSGQLKGSNLTETGRRLDSNYLWEHEKVEIEIINEVCSLQNFFEEFYAQWKGGQ